MAKHRTYSVDLKRQVALEKVQEYEGRVAALERLVGRQALEIEFLKGARPSTASARNGPTSVIAGPTACPSPEGAT